MALQYAGAPAGYVITGNIASTSTPIVNATTAICPAGSFITSFSLTSYTFCSDSCEYNYTDLGSLSARCSKGVQLKPVHFTYGTDMDGCTTPLVFNAESPAQVISQPTGFTSFELRCA